MFLNKLVLVLAFAAFSSQAHAVLPVTSNNALSSIRFGGADDDKYRIGDEWGKKPVTTEMLKDATPAFRRAALATAKLENLMGHGTAFYLGYFNGRHVMATNHHVCENTFDCVSKTAKFQMLGMEFRVKSLIGSWPEIDSAFFTIEVKTEAQAQALARVAANYDFRGSIYPGEPLITIGHGSGNNKKGVLVANQDYDCKVFSEKDEFRFMADPDDISPAPYKAWSFANGCDVSHGDSGSAMVDRSSGKVVGIIWTGRIPKSEKIQNSKYLDQIFAQHSEEIWKELSYAVPAAKIAEHLSSLINSGKFNETDRATLTEILAR